ncbi:hypothetical protein [Arthrobacter sp. MMS18-M83]|uniref:hypothetical protein n=1 Tax=Arthrobacter sp. MMS18-M83 TaxID=2996261 RepID=UPI00227A31D8|nr:hypothetical protein [Arthrobacter sp. MMS18-M83]WAH96987.1 hypothetical protein OW521_21965 [Arthrobacter sp. MMS18-M83]
MTIQPLPVPTRIFGGEGLISYAFRRAARNGTPVEEIERVLYEVGAIPKPSHRRTPERLQAWRSLGSLHESAFATPAVIDGADVIDRALCLRCTQGSGGTGRLPRIGWVCARHRRWLGTPQHDIRALPELIAAERHYRRALAPRGVLVGSPLMLWARECATTVLSPSTYLFQQTPSGNGPGADPPPTSACSPTPKPSESPVLSQTRYSTHGCSNQGSDPATATR